MSYQAQWDAWPLKLYFIPSSRPQSSTCSSYESRLTALCLESLILKSFLAFLNARLLFITVLFVMLLLWCGREIRTNTLVMLTKCTEERAYWIETSNCVKTKAQRSLRTPSGCEKRPARRTHSYGQKLSACTPKWSACNLDTNFLWQQFRSPVSYAISFT